MDCASGRDARGFLPKVVLVTGASAGFGRAIAECFLAAGSRVVAAARRAKRLDDLASSWPEACLPLELDVRDRDAIGALPGALPAAFECVDLLVNNAGLALGLKPAHAASLDDWDRMIDTNVKGLCYLTRAILPEMVERDRGHIVNIGSIAGSYPYRGANVYGSTKAFVAQFSRNLRADLLGTRVRVTNIEPGLARTEFSEVRFKGDKARADSVYDRTEPITGKDIAEVVLFCATLPPHLNINRIELMPTCQAAAGVEIARTAR